MMEGTEKKRWEMRAERGLEILTEWKMNEKIQMEKRENWIQVRTTELEYERKE
jgi:hypothetical protein